MGWCHQHSEATTARKAQHDVINLEDGLRWAGAEQIFNPSSDRSAFILVHAIKQRERSPSGANVSERGLDAATHMNECVHTETCSSTLQLFALLPKMCHQMSRPSASFHLAEHPVIILQMATSTLCPSLCLYSRARLPHSHTHMCPHASTAIFSPSYGTSKSANLASVERLSLSVARAVSCNALCRLPDLPQQWFSSFLFCNI